MLHKQTFSARALFCMGCGMGALVFLLVFTAAPLVITNDAWLRTGFVEKDITQHYTGWLFLRQSALQFPLGALSTINYPYGSAVTFTDSIPLFAILFRFFEPWLPETFQYFGLFTLLCYMLHGGITTQLLLLFTKKAPAIFCGTALFLCAPVLLERTFRHTALAAQWLLLYALYLYFKNKKQGFCYRKGYLVTLALAVTIHPYFIPMLFGILFADLLEHCLASKEYAKSALFLASAFAIVLGVGACIGIFSVPASGEILVGFGHFGMNLNSLWTPVSTGNLIWSSVLPPQNQGLGTVEGFNYLGLAVLIAAPLCLAHALWQLKWAGVRALLRKHCGLCFVFICLTLFALSNAWVANIRVLFILPLPKALQAVCDIFRASGRMFWPVYYTVFLFVTVHLATLFTAPAKKHLQHVGCALLCLVLVVQVADMRAVLWQKHAFFASPTPTFTSERADPLWDEIATSYQHLYSLDDYLYDATDLALFAANNGMTTNDGFSARFDALRHRADVAEEIARMQEGIYQADTFYITSDENTFAQVAHACQGKAYAVRIDWHWYAILPIVDGITPPTQRETLFVYPVIPLMIPDFSDDDFSHGISNENPATITLFLNPFTTLYLGAATTIVDEAGTAYDILEYNYNEDGRFIITLDIPDASVLKGQYLTSSDNSDTPHHY